MDFIFHFLLFMENINQSKRKVTDSTHCGRQLTFFLFVLRFYGPVNPMALGHVERGQFT